MAFCPFCQLHGIWDHLSCKTDTRSPWSVKCTMAQLLSFPDCPFNKLVKAMLLPANPDLFFTVPLVWARGLEFIPHTDNDNGRSFAIRVQESSETAGSIRAEELQHVFPVKTASDQCREFLDNCEQNHADCFMAVDLDSPANALDMILIDVKRACLVEARPTFRYLTLSYVWGKPWQSLTTKHDFSKRQIPGSLTRTVINQVVKDAMELVRAIGETYLWVDTLCIIQDDEDFKARQIAAMDIIYSRGIACICAISGTNSDAPLPGVRPGTAPPQHEAADDKVALVMVRGEGTLQEQLEDSVYDTRGWCFQERHLSRRCMYFADRAVFFTCQTDRMSKVEPKAEPTPTLSGRLIAPLHFLGDTFTFHQSTPQEQQRLFQYVYGELVENYTKRNFTRSSDIIIAFTGIINRLNSYMDWNFVCGMPTKFLEFSLLWISYIESEDALPVVQRNDQFPSWSWAGSVSLVTYKFALGLMGFCYWCDYQLVPQILRFDVKELATGGNSPVGGEKWALVFETPVLSARTFDCIKTELFQGYWRSILKQNGDLCGFLYDYEAAPADPDETLEYILIARMIAPVVEDPENPPSQNLMLAEIPADFFGGDHLSIVMIIRWNGEYAVREGVGIIFEGRWLSANPNQKTVTLV
jgi:hypothetical protein